MDFDLSEEQNILKDSISRLLSDKYSFEKRMRYQQSAKGWSEALWADYAEMGLLAMSFAEEDGGLGGSDVDRMVVSEALGKALILEPYFATVVLGGSILRHGGTVEQRSRLVPQVAEGRLKLAFAYLEPHSRYDLGDVQTRADSTDDGWRISGKKTVVLHGGSADKIFVTARTGDVAGGETPVGLFLVDAKAPGVSIQDYLTHDGLHAADITCDGVSVAAQDVFGIPGKALPLVQRVVDDAIAALCAEALGAMTIMLDLTVDYLKVRNQFGGPIGRFQALQHRASEMYVAVEQAGP
jgi:alkylation response protein AidB-like acyl-CoA dehydrogenase